MNSFKEYISLEEKKKDEPIGEIVEVCLYLLRHLKLVYQDDKAKTYEITKMIKNLRKLSRKTE